MASTQITIYFQHFPLACFMEKQTLIEIICSTKANQSPFIAQRGMDLFLPKLTKHRSEASLMLQAYIKSLLLTNR